MIVRYIATATIPNSEKELAINVQHQLPAAASSLQQNQVQIQSSHGCVFP